MRENLWQTFETVEPARKSGAFILACTVMEDLETGARDYMDRPTTIRWKDGVWHDDFGHSYRDGDWSHWQPMLPIPQDKS